MPLQNWREVVQAHQDGYQFFSAWRKQATQTTGANIWFDLSMSPGNPVPNYYIGPAGVFTRLAQSTDGGVPHGPNCAPRQKFLRLLEAQTATAAATPLPLYLLDYLGFYPFLDESVTDEQFLDNTLVPTRYAQDQQIQVMPVVVAGHTGGQSFKISYTNSQGVSGRISPAHLMGTQIVNGTIITSAGALADSRAPFMALQDGDTGVRRVDSITFLGTGDIGLISLVLVRLIARHQIRGIDAPSEQDFFMDSAQMPIIQDDAYLNLLACPAGNLSAAPIHGYIQTVNV